MAVPQGKWVGPGEQLASAIERSDGTLTPKQHGRLIRIGASATEWNTDKPWTGRELQSWTSVVSLWNKALVIRFCMVVDGRQYPSFTLELQPPMSKEEIEATANTYMTILNMRREDGTFGQ